MRRLEESGRLVSSLAGLSALYFNVLDNTSCKVQRAPLMEITPRSFKTFFFLLCIHSGALAAAKHQLSCLYGK